MSAAGDEFFFSPDPPAEEKATVLRCRALELPGLVHGFTTRRGGVCEGVAASLNFGEQGSSAAERRRNIARLGEALLFDTNVLFRVHQVHGDRVLALGSSSSVAEVAGERADALVTAPGRLIAIQTADCAPVLLCDPGRRIVGAAHAGWRSLVGGVIENTIAAMERHHGCVRAELIAVVGPCIGPCCFEVGPEVAARFSKDLISYRSLGGRPHVDLGRAARLSLLDAGLAPKRVALSPRVTCCEGDVFYSYRRQGPKTGRHLSLIGYVE